MYKYMLEQEQLLINSMKTGTNLEDLYDYSKVQIAWLSHERIVHLLVTFFIGFLVLMSFIGFMLLGNLLIGFLFVILTILVLFYVVHYFRLENGVQRLYKISNQILDKIIN